MSTSKRFVMADLFCGAGGTSTGAIEAIEALGYEVELTAINHWPVAIDTHKVNHPKARNLCTGLDVVNPRDLFKEGELDLLWASPECTHHSTARGGKPINDQSRATAWCVVRWAEALRPGIILVENVPEFETWGAIGTNGRPLKTKRGATFLAWVSALESLGYSVDWQVLCAANYGDPTTRKRLFVQAVRGRRKVTWPAATHAAPPSELDLQPQFAALAEPARQPWRTAKDSVIDWTIPGKSIYERKRPLSPKTMRRIMAGLEKFGLKPFMTPGMGERPTQAPRTHSVDEPAPTVTAQGHMHLAEPFIITMEHQGSVRSADRPLPTITTAKGGAMAVAQPYIVRMHGTSNATDIEKPLGTVEAGPVKHMLAEPFLIPQHSSNGARGVDKPAPTVTTTSRGIGLAEPFLVHTAHGKDRRARSVEEPMPVVAGNRGDMALCEPFIILAETEALVA